MTINLGTLPQWLPWQQVKIPCNTYYCVFLDNGDVYEHQTVHKCYPLYGCHDNIIIMLPWQPSKNVRNRWKMASGNISNV